mmetsp:Transcript_18828/g.42962  ORF Transcript_18828/g.42962 Transcript_18828/m.42962 type:complete len:221 (+) Transcript_18828:323-985(+)
MNIQRHHIGFHEEIDKRSKHFFPRRVHVYDVGPRIERHGLPHSENIDVGRHDLGRPPDPFQAVYVGSDAPVEQHGTADRREDGRAGHGQLAGRGNRPVLQKEQRGQAHERDGRGGDRDALQAQRRGREGRFVEHDVVGSFLRGRRVRRPAGRRGGIVSFPARERRRLEHRCVETELVCSKEEPTGSAPIDPDHAYALEHAHVHTWIETRLDTLLDCIGNG